MEEVLPSSFVDYQQLHQHQHQQQQQQQLVKENQQHQNEEDNNNNNVVETLNGTEELSMSLAFAQAGLKCLSPLLNNKLVLHRGWHQAPWCCSNRPMENTRQAYLDAVQLGMKYAECDVWSTRDGVIILNHDSHIHPSNPSLKNTIGASPLSQLDWDDIKNVELQSGTTPTRLSTVLGDLLGTNTRLVIELKGDSAAQGLISFLAKHTEYVDAVAWIMSFDFGALQLLWNTMLAEDVDVVSAIPLHFIVDNPSKPFTGPLSPGQLTFNVSEGEGVADFLEKNGLLESFLDMGCGLYLQYNVDVNPAQVARVREELVDLYMAHDQNRSNEEFGADGNMMPLQKEKRRIMHDNPRGSAAVEERDGVFVGLWVYMVHEGAFDNYEVMEGYTDVLDAINTDLSLSFFESQNNNS